MPHPGTVWEPGTWGEDAWAADTWGDAQETPPSGSVSAAAQVVPRVRATARVGPSASATARRVPARIGSMTRKPLPINSDVYVEFLGARDSADDSYLNSGTCTYALYLAPTTPGGSRTAVTGGTGTLSYVAASNGNYRGVIESTITGTLTKGLPYDVVITFVQGNYNREKVLLYRAAEDIGED